MRHGVTCLTQKLGSIHLSRRGHLHAQEGAGPLICEDDAPCFFFF